MHDVVMNGNVALLSKPSMPQASDIQDIQNTFTMFYQNSGPFLIQFLAARLGELTFIASSTRFNVSKRAFALLLSSFSCLL